MKDGQNIRLFKRVSNKGYMPEHVAEVGVYHPESSNVYAYIKRGVQCTLVEPDPNSIALIQNHFQDHKTLKLFTCAVCDFNGTVELFRKGSSTFVSDLKTSPAIANDDYEAKEDDKFVAEAKTFDRIDDGSIDLLSIDTEGCEWFVIKNMTSRPVVISIETHGGLYTNPYLKEIQNWMNSNNYVLWYKDKSDSIFVSNDKIQVSVAEKILLIITNINLVMQKIKKKCRKKIKSWVQ